MEDKTRFPFAKKRLERLPTPATGRAVYHDTATPGLTLRVTAKGQKSFHYYRKFRGSPMTMHLGDFPEMSVENARNACQTASGKAAQGIDPRAERRAVKHEQTWKGLWAYWLEGAKQRGVKTLAEDERRWRRFLAPWANRKLSAIRKNDVQALFAKVTADNGPYAANRLLALVKSIFHKAPDMGFSGPDPTAGIKKYKDEKRDRFLHARGVEGVFRRPLCRAERYFSGPLACRPLDRGPQGQRDGNAMGGNRLSTGLWRIPQTKSGKSRDGAPGRLRRWRC